MQVDSNTDHLRIDRNFRLNKGERLLAGCSVGVVLVLKMKCESIARNY